MTFFPSKSAASLPVASSSNSHPINGQSNRQPIRQPEAVFNQLIEAIGNQLSKQSSGHKAHHFTLSLAGENSQFTRFNNGKVRQSGQVGDAQLHLTLMNAQQTTQARFPFVGEFQPDWATAQQALSDLQSDLRTLPEDPYIVLPGASERGRSREIRGGQLIPSAAVAETILASTSDLDFSGLYAGGTSYRAYGDSVGKRHWFETPSFTLDYSLFTARNSAVKGTLAGQTWCSATYQESIKAAQQQLALLEKPLKSVPKGTYRTYLAPAAVADLMDMLVYGGLGEASLRQGNSAFEKLEKGEATLSKKFSLGEDFQRVGVPRFNSLGISAPNQLPIIQQGQWKTSLVSDRSAKEYGKPSNAASRAESLRAPVVATGQLSEEHILSALDTGLYLSNLHYLNWSDLTAGRITGMTRYACFWVENGEIVAPIENLRFDDSFYRFLSEDALLGLTQRQSFLPAVDTYERRSLGGMWVPGMLIDQFRYTL
ncbi:MAG: metallopeptidase TldD-related protein [Cyanobacteria bacterium P01_D01_bin.105]